MNKTYLVLPILLVAVVSLSLTAQTANEAEGPLMFDLLEPGQFVHVRESTCGYQIRIYNPKQIEGEIAGIKSRRDKAGPQDGNQSTPRQAFETMNPVVKAVTADHITLVHGHGYERHIASCAIVEISRYTD